MVVEARFARWAVLLALAGCNGGSVAPDTSAPDMGAASDFTMCWCVSNADCSSSTPFCLGDCSPCVECRGDPDCAPGTICNVATHGCWPGCTATHLCDPDSDTPFCDEARGRCVYCRRDSDCSKWPDTPSCWIERGECWPCVPERDICPPGQYCANVGRESTRFGCSPGCKDNADCPPPDAGSLTACVEHTCVQP